MNEVTAYDVTGLPSLLSKAAEHRGRDDGMPALLIIGNVGRDIECDGTVAAHVGYCCGEAVYEIVPRIYEILPDGGVKVTDDDPDWIGAGNDEVTTIPGSHVWLCVVANDARSEKDGRLRLPEGVTNVLEFPAVKTDD
jgi:hypothetical protein